MARKVLSGAFGVDLSRVHTETSYDRFAYRTMVEADSGVYIYGQASGAIDEGALCFIDETGQVAELDSTGSGSTPKECCVCVSAGGLADDQEGWFWRGKGVEEVLVANSVADDAALTTTANAGIAGAGGDAVNSLVTTEANSSGAARLTTCQAAGLLSTNE